MSLFAEIRARAHHIIGPVLGVCMVAYFGYHIVQGDRGYFALRKLQKEVAAAKVAYAQVHGERLALAHRVKLLSPGTLDPDMLDERVRLMLNYGRADEKVIMFKGNP
ncbi:FtsB family cell division protein [Varunaivibrio sulfuroxidans]|uniref:Septum formation initiator n=1 Tax=Varunaivibrio sulfuroxidans TaxID=1773489 RepID=A0A4R3JG64_9PROT|nr:septum formation initiator family protein [Varunaivibrio sulfuroxidans]TCS64196.1 septum formation initiator [Varunaivibrio sulfuroxidans]WES31359.1 septum formation initiator family protein [Varunaivibrio sulfuroxidans]